MVKLKGVVVIKPFEESRWTMSDVTSEEEINRIIEVFANGVINLTKKYGKSVVKRVSEEKARKIVRKLGGFRSKEEFKYDYGLKLISNDDEMVVLIFRL